MKINRAQGCLLGQLAGDSLGALVEFHSADDISSIYPNGVRELVDGGVWNTIAGQPTDDSEMALLLARMLVKNGRYDPVSAMNEYRYWISTDPFDCGMTIRSSLSGHPNPDSQANGAMMRISPLGIFGANYELNVVAEWAQLDASLTHPNSVCKHANALYSMAIANAVESGTYPKQLYKNVKRWASEMNAEPSLLAVIDRAPVAPPENYTHLSGWVLIAFHNALYQLLHAMNLEKGVIDTVMRGGDTDTNAAICGALLGSVYGYDAIPEQWANALLNCRPQKEDPRVMHPRPECFWPVDAIELAERLVSSRN